MIVMLLGYSIIAVPTGIVAGETLDEHKRQRNKKNKTRRMTELRDENPTITEADPGVRAKDEDLM